MSLDITTLVLQALVRERVAFRVFGAVALNLHDRYKDQIDAERIRQRLAGT